MHGLHHVVIEARLARLGLIRGQAVTSDGDELDAPAVRCGADAPGNLVAVEAGEPHVHEGRIGLHPEHELDAGGAVAGAGKGMESAGKVRVKTLPIPGPALTASIAPPWSSARRLTRVRPMPRPPWDRSAPRSPCTKRSKMRGSRSGWMPAPLSSTRRTARSPCWEASMLMAPPGGV